jgi:uncharacterized protein (DUF2336 family)
VEPFAARTIAPPPGVLRLERRGARLDDAALRAALRDLRRTAPPAKRIAFTRLFAQHFERLIGTEERPAVLTTLGLLLEDSEPGVRAMLAALLAPSPLLPVAAAERLAQGPIACAGPVLELSPALDDDRLAALLQAAGPAHAAAVAGRSWLSPALAALVARRADRAGRLRLVGNHGAALDTATLEWLQAEHADDDELLDLLARRPGLPAGLVDRFVDRLGDRLDWALVSKRALGPADAGRLPTARTAHVQRGFEVGSEQERAALAKLEAQAAAGALGPPQVLALLRDGQVGMMEAGLAVLAGTSMRRVRAMLYGPDKRGLVALCLRAGWTTPEYLALRMALGLAEQAAGQPDGAATYSAESAAFVREQYEQARRSLAAAAGRKGQGGGVGSQAGTASCGEAERSQAGVPPGAEGSMVQ